MTFNEENTIQGIKYSSKVQASTPICAPSCTARHTSTDEGNSIPRMFRCSLPSILADGNNFLFVTGFPFGAVVQPFAELGMYESQIPLSKNGADFLQRCCRCGAYPNSGFTYIEGGNTIKCNMCQGLTPIPTNIINGGSAEKPELQFGTCDFIAPVKLAGKKVTGNNILLVIDCGTNAINFGKIT